jgi:uncharacterized membrane protein YhaH (DUF805 family)
MTNSKQLAGLIGPTLIALSISEGINLRTLATSNANLLSVVYLNGTLLFVAGLSIVRVHNRWTRGWPVLITLLGWFTILGGLIRMYAPVLAQQGVQNTTAVFALLIVLFALGAFLTLKAYRGEDSKTAMQAGPAR